MIIAAISISIIYLFCNLVATFTMSLHDMRQSFASEQTALGRVRSICMYAPAYALKGFKIIINKLIK